MHNKSDQVARPRTQNDTLKELFSDKKNAFLDALECLYIPNNIGARANFSEKWPDAAVVIFDDELMRFDFEGVKSDEDRNRRAVLENAAEDRRLEMLELFENIDTRLVHQGSLQLEALNTLMVELNRPIAEYIFAERFVTRYFPLDNAAPLDGGADNSAAAQISAEDTKGYSPSPSLLLKTGTKPAAPRPIVRNIVNVSDIVPEKSIESIGHVDHSYNTPTPAYSAQGEAQEEEDMSWLDVSEEDEFGDVKPISVGQTSAPVEAAVPKSEPKPDPVSLSEPVGAADTLKDAPAPAKEEDGELPPGITKMNQPRRPSFSSSDDGVSLAGAGSVSGSLSGMTFDKNKSAQAAAPTVDEAANTAEPPAPKPEEKPAPRVPRLEDLDKHVPPIPGTEDDY